MRYFPFGGQPVNKKLERASFLNLDVLVNLEYGLEQEQSFASRAVASHFCAQGELMNFAPPQGRTEKLVSGRGWPEYLATFFSTRRPTSKISVQKNFDDLFFFFSNFSHFIMK
jgi:hypothetical protein